MRILRVSIIALLAAMGATAAFFWLTPFAMDGVRVSAGFCDASPETETTIKDKWSGATYQLEIDQAENCAESLDRVSVQRLGNHLFVGTRFRSPSGMLTSCYCRHRTNLGIPSLPSGKYQTHVYALP